jgi:hypothetical protein
MIAHIVICIIYACIQTAPENVSLVQFPIIVPSLKLLKKAHIARISDKCHIKR